MCVSLMRQRILMHLKVYHLHLHLIGKEAHRTHLIMDKEIIIIMEEVDHQVVGAVAVEAHPSVAVQQVEVA